MGVAGGDGPPLLAAPEVSMRAAMFTLIALACLLAAKACLEPGAPWGRERAGNRHVTLVLPPGPSSHNLLSRILARDEVARGLIAGEFGLIEAARRFRQIEADWPAPGDRTAERSRDGERLCRGVIRWA